VKYKYVVFDWDGTIADTYPVISAAFEYAFEKVKGKRVAYDEIKKITSGMQNREIWKHLFGDMHNEGKNFYTEYIEQYHIKNLNTISGAKELLDFCRSKGMQNYLCTNKRTKFINQELNYLNLCDYFKKIVAAGEYEEDKPSPIACREIFDNNLPPVKDIVVIGDGEGDVKSAMALNGADSIIYDPENKYKGIKPTYKVKSLAEVKAILEGKSGE